MKICIGIPTSRYLDANCPISLDRWLATNKDYIPYVRYDATAGRQDWSRSTLILWAREMKARWLIMLDTDCEVLTHFEKTIEYLEECSNLGYDVVIAPTCSYQGKVMLKMKDPSQATGLKPFEIEAGAFGFVAWSHKIVQRLQSVGDLPSVDGALHPMFGFEGKETEDWSFCGTAISQGFKICMDPRIEVGHMKQVQMLCGWSDAPQAGVRPGVMRCVQNLDGVKQKGEAAVNPRPELRIEHQSVSL